MLTNSNARYEFPKETEFCSLPYTDLDDLISKNPELSKKEKDCSALNEVERLIKWHVSVTDCIYSIDRGTIKSLPACHEYINTAFQQSDFIMRIENRNYKKQLNIYFGPSKDDRSRQMTGCDYHEVFSFGCYYHDLVPEMAGYIDILFFNRGRGFKSDRLIPQRAKSAVHSLEGSIHSILLRRS